MSSRAEGIYIHIISSTIRPITINLHAKPSKEHSQRSYHIIICRLIMLEQEMYCRGIYYLHDIYNYKPSLVLKPESYCKRGGGGGGGGGVFSSEYSTGIRLTEMGVEVRLGYTGRICSLLLLE